MKEYRLTHLRELESEGICNEGGGCPVRAAGASLSGGKDSIVLVHLARKAFWPAPIPFPLLHIDTGHNFDEAIDFRDDLVRRLNARLIVGSVQESIDNGRAVEESGYYASRNMLQTVTLLDSIEKNKVDALSAAAVAMRRRPVRRSGSSATATSSASGTRKTSGPSCGICSTERSVGEHFRVFPISNWTEMDVRQYILLENIDLPSIYFTHERNVFFRDGVWLAAAPFMKLKPGEKVEYRRVRCRTVGDITCTGLTLSTADTLEDIIREIAATRVTERGGRYDDKRSDAAMEDRKKEGYF